MFEIKSIETIQSEEQKGKKNKEKMNRTSETCGIT